MSGDIQDTSRNDSKQFVVVDNLNGARRGWTDMINDLQNASVVASLDFPEAMERASWTDVDVVICDMADEPLSEEAAKRSGRVDEQSQRHSVTDFTSIELIERIKRGDQPPVVIAVTGHSFVFDNPVLRRAVREARADYFVHRGDLDATLESLVGANGQASALLSVLPPPTADDEIPELGITKATNVLGLLREISKEKYKELFESAKLSHRLDRASERLRSAAEAAAGQLRGANAKGERAQTIRFVTIRKIKDLGTRIPSQYRNR